MRLELNNPVAYAFFLVVSLLAIVAIGTYLQPTGTVISSSGLIQAVGVGVYVDFECNEKVAFIDWGIMWPGAIKNLFYHLRNERQWNLVVAKSEADWQPPEACDFIFLTWNYKNKSLANLEVIPIVFTLSVSPFIQNITSFSHTIILTEL